MEGEKKQKVLHGNKSYEFFFLSTKVYKWVSAMDQQPIHGGEEILLIFMLEGLRKTREFLQCNAMQCNAMQYNNRAPLHESGTKAGQCHIVHGLKCQ